jgi:hypothetical protein
MLNFIPPNSIDDLPMMDNRSVEPVRRSDVPTP